MKHLNWKVWTGIILVFLSVFFYFIHYLIFRDAHHIFIYLIGDIAFVPLEVLLVTLIIERLLHEREKQTMLKKMNMLIGAFYSEAGTRLIEYFSAFADMTELNKKLLIDTQWTDKDFTNAVSYIKSVEHKLDCKKGDIHQLRDFLESKRSFLLVLLENPFLLEHDAFTDLIWAILHLSEELSARDNVDALPITDYEHLAGDMKRAYKQLIVQWVMYVKHLKEDYPYLFSLAVRTNPWNLKASAVVKQ